MIYLNDYKTFDDVQEMNLQVKKHVSKHYYEMNDTDREALYFISRYSVKYPGASHLKVETIAKAINRSRSTAKRVITKLIKLGIIERVTTLRKIKGGHGANIYRILPCISSNEPSKTNQREDDRKPTQTSDEETDKQDETINLISDLNNTLLETEKPAKPNRPTEDEIIKRSLRNAIPRQIYDALSPFFNGQGLYNVYGILLRAKAKIDRSIRLEEYGSRYIDAFYNVIRLYKAGKVRSLNGLLYVTWERLTAEISRQINARKSALFNDFCEIVG